MVDVTTQGVIDLPGAIPGNDMPPRHLTYKEIADDLAERIRAGEEGYRPGDQLPSYKALADLYSVSISTASRAYGLLQDRGLTESVVGRGTFVPERDNT